MNQKEIRSVGGRLEFREAQSPGTIGTLAGYSARFNQLSVDLGGFRELVAPAAFKRSLAAPDCDVRMLVNHDSRLVLGRQAAKTLTVREDDQGLFVECALPDTSYARDLAVAMKRGDVTGQSFGFFVVQDSWAAAEGQIVRTLRDVDLVEASVATFPAYPQTSAAVRDRFLAFREQLPSFRDGRNIQVNEAGLEEAKAAIQEGRVDEDSAWNWDAEAQNGILGDQDWKRYGLAHLGVAPDENPETKARFAYPWGKMKDGKLTLYRRAVAGDRQRSSQHGHEAIFKAAGELMELLDAKKKGRETDWLMLERRQRLAELG